MSNTPLIQPTLTSVTARGLTSDRCIFPDDRLFLRRMAYVASRDGLDSATYSAGQNGGIWQVGLKIYIRCGSLAATAVPRRLFS